MIDGANDFKLLSLSYIYHLDTHNDKLREEMIGKVLFARLQQLKVSQGVCSINQPSDTKLINV